MEKKTIYAKIHDAKLEIGKVAKNAKNPHFKNTYADLNALIEAVEPILLEKGLLLLQPIKDGKVYSIIVDASSSETIESFIELPTGIAPQPMGSAITYYRRYTLQSLLSLQAVDDDGQQASQPVAPTKQTMDAETFEKARQAIIDRKTTLEKIKAKYMLTTTQSIELLNLKSQ